MSEPYQLLESEFAEWNGLDPAGMVVTNSGTAALHLALEAMQLPPGSEVVTSDFNMVAVPRAVTLAGLRPRFVDCGDDLLMDLDNGALVDHNPEAIILVHIYGRSPDVECVHRFYDPHAAPPPKIIEDLAEAHGVKPHPQTDAATWSFFRNKCISGEEGGAVWFRDPAHAALARQLRTLGFTPEHNYEHIPRGHNYRLANCLAEKIRASLRVADTNIKVRRVIEGWYDQRCPEAWRMPARSAPWVYDLKIPGLTRDQQRVIVKTLNAEDIAARMGFWPMSEQEEYRGCRVSGSGNARRMGECVFYLPIMPWQVTEADAERSFEIIRRVADSFK